LGCNHVLDAETRREDAEKNKGQNAVILADAVSGTLETERDSSIRRTSFETFSMCKVIP
jgi:hypothetical protein